MGSVFYRDPGHNYPVAVRGEGVYLYDANGKEYLDGSGGAAITCLGYCHPEVSKANAVQSGQPPILVLKLIRSYISMWNWVSTSTTTSGLHWVPPTCLIRLLTQSGLPMQTA